ncbi:MAG: hypothetical protein JW395_2095 [Nitrospira sp.]|nr:hypothetical protein [Nitrospira sp.]
MKGQLFFHTNMGDRIVELHRDMPDRMRGIEAGEIFLNSIEAFTNRLVDVGIRDCNREWTLEFPPVIHELHRLFFRRRRVVPLQLPRANHPTTIRQSDPNQVGFNRHRLFQYCRCNIRRGSAGFLSGFG